MKTNGPTRWSVQFIYRSIYGLSSQIQFAAYFKEKLSLIPVIQYLIFWLPDI